MARRASQSTWLKTAARLTLCLIAAGSASVQGGARPPNQSRQRPAPETPPPPACRYTVTVIQSPLMCGSQPESGNAKAIAADGTVAGERYCSASSRRPFLWSVADGYQALAGAPGVGDTSVAGLNSKLEIVGEANGAPIRGYLRKPSGEYLFLGFPPAGTFSTASGVNDSSIVVGTWGNQVSGLALVPCTWHQGVMTDLSPLLPGIHGEAEAINSRGQITGWTGTAISVDSRAFIIDGDRVNILPPIPGGFSSAGTVINEDGAVAGRGGTFAPELGINVSRPFIYENGRMRLLEGCVGTTHVVPYGIRDYLRTLIRWSRRYQSRTHAS